MPKWRKLYTKTVDSLDLNDMPDDFTRLLWILLPLELDRCGRGLDNPAWVRSKIFPLRQDVTVDDVSEAMNWYESRGMIERYEQGGRKYFWIPTWHKYQGNTSREADSDFPPPPSYNDPYDDKTSSGATREQVKSKSISDVDVDVDTDTEVEVEVDEDDPRNPFSLYEQTNGPLSKYVADELNALIDEMEEHRQDIPEKSWGHSVGGEEWVCLALEEAAQSTDSFNLKYLKRILDRWKRDGLQAKRGGNGKGSAYDGIDFGG